jgi:hypothetical protein
LFNEALITITENGVLAELVAKWFEWNKKESKWIPFFYVPRINNSSPIFLSSCPVLIL